MMTPDLYPVHDGTDGTGTIAHLNAVVDALDDEMVPRNVERLDIRELEVIDFYRLGFPHAGDAANAKWQTRETEGPGGQEGRRRRGREPEKHDVEAPAVRGLECDAFRGLRVLRVLAGVGLKRPIV
jgi:hypothetical protein